jgi:hypothetical protein
MKQYLEAWRRNVAMKSAESVYRISESSAHAAGAGGGVMKAMWLKLATLCRRNAMTIVMKKAVQSMSAILNKSAI